jgi:hypothetical protein
MVSWLYGEVGSCYWMHSTFCCFGTVITGKEGLRKKNIKPFIYVGTVVGNASG